MLKVLADHMVNCLLKVIAVSQYPKMLKDLKNSQQVVPLPRAMPGRSKVNLYEVITSSLQGAMKKVNKQCLLDTPRTVRVSEKTWQVIVRTRRP